MSRRRDPRAGERGFALIGAIWVLTLAGSIVALLLLASKMKGEAVNVAASVLAAQLAERSAAETVVAERLFLGARSRWWLLPAEGSVQVGDQIVRLRVSDTSRKFDFAGATMADRAEFLRRLGLSEPEQRVVLRSLRGQQRAGVQTLMSRANLPEEALRQICDHISPFGNPKLDEISLPGSGTSQSHARGGSLIAIANSDSACGRRFLNRSGSRAITLS